MAIVNTGLNRIAALISSDITHAAIGTGSTPVQASDIALETQTDRNAISKKTRTGNVIEARTLFGTTEISTAGIEEVGIFTASTGGTMYNRRLFSYAKSGSRDLLLVQTITVRNP